MVKIAGHLRKTSRRSGSRTTSRTPSVSRSGHTTVNKKQRNTLVRLFGLAVALSIIRRLRTGGSSHLTTRRTKKRTVKREKSLSKHFI